MGKLNTIKPKVKVIDTKVVKSKVVERERGRPWMRRRQRIMERDGYLCQTCSKSGKVTVAEEVDHIIPLSVGGRDDDGNLQAICKECHQSKTTAEGGERARW